MGKFFYGFEDGLISRTWAEEHWNAGLGFFNAREFEKAMFHLRRASVYKHVAYLCMGYCYAHGVGGVKQNFAIARLLYNEYSERPPEKWVREYKLVDDELLKNSCKSDIEDIFFDEELGNVRVIYSLRCRECPYVSFNQNEIVVHKSQSKYEESAFKMIFGKLSDLDHFRKNDDLGRIDDNFRREYPLFQLSVKRGDVSKLSYHNDGSLYCIIVPKETDFNLVQTREAIIEYAMKLMKKEAQRYLSSRTKYISEKIGLPYKTLEIIGRRHLWGKFDSNNQHLQLSYHLLKSTSDFVDAVIVHELIHNLRYQHDDQFYKLMEQYSSRELAETDKKEIGASNIWSI